MFNIIWQKVAAEKYPHGLPKLLSNDATQWLFKGHPAGADQQLQVAVARLLGYQWPRQAGSSFPDCPALGAVSGCGRSHISRAAAEGIRASSIRDE